MDWAGVIAGYAAGVSTIVGLRQITVDLPKVRVDVFRDARLIPQNQRVVVVEVTNAGRRPVRITMAGFLGSGPTFLETPGRWIDELIFGLDEGESRSLRIDPEMIAVPDDAVFVVRDSVGRWWPRSQRPRLWIRARLAKRAQRRRPP